MSRRHPLLSGLRHWQLEVELLEERLKREADHELVGAFRRAVRREFVAKRKYETWKSESPRSTRADDGGGG